MNFLLGGDDGDGWDDDDGLGDLSDQSLGEEEDEQVGHGLANNAPPPPPPPPPPQNPSGGAVSMGGGMFMGRLTRFLDAVTQPDDEYEDEEEDGDGWGDDLGLDDVDVDGDGDVDGADVANGESNGWGEDDELNFDDSPVKTVQPPPPQPQPPQNEPAPTQSQLMDSGWDDDLDLDGLEEPAQPQPPPPPPPKNNAASLTTSSARRPDAVIPLNDVAPPRSMANVVDHTPAPPPRYNRNVSFDASLAVVGSVQTLDDNLGTSAADAEAPSSGWDDTDDGLDDLDLEGAGGDNAAPAVDQTPPPPPPPPPRQISNITNSISTSAGDIDTNVAVATSTQSSGWDDEFDDIDVDGDANDSKPLANGDGGVKMLDHTPPPPPPPAPRENSLTVSFGGTSDTEARLSALTNTWDGDDSALDNIDNEDQNTPMVDVTPPPPPPPRSNQVAGVSLTAVAEGTDDGWGDDDDILGEEENSPQEVTPVVDHTPPPPLPHFHRSGTNAAIVGDDDDISRDDTLSIDNSKSNLALTSIGMALSDDGSKEQQPNMVDRTPDLHASVPFKRSETTEAVRSGVSVSSSTLDDYRASLAGDSLNGDGQAPSTTNLVDQTPSLANTNPENQSTVDPSMVALGGGTGSSVGDSLDSFDHSRDPRTPRAGKMVDHTPQVRSHRQDASLAVAGHTSVGESLDSIDEADEEPDSGHKRPDSTPGAVESGWGGDVMRDYTVSIQPESMEIPFGAAVTPTATGGPRGLADSTGEGEPPAKEGTMPLVDHMPTPLTKSRSVAASVDVLSVSSEEGDLGASDDEVDNIKDDLYCQVVDHTPATPGQSTPKKSVQGDAPSTSEATKQEDDTVLGVADRRDVEFDLKQDEGMDDESSKGTQGTSVIGTLEDTEVRSLLGGSVRLAIVEERHLVDHVPETKGQRPADASTMVLADASSTSSRVDDTVVNDDDTAPAGFGPIVDHTPGVMQRSISARSVATSVVTQMTEIKAEEDLDTAMTPGAGTESADSDRQSTRTPLPEEKHLVDRVPKRSKYRAPMDLSIRVLVDNNDDMTQVDTIAEDTVVNFGPIVDQTPFSVRSAAFSGAASMATQGSAYGVDGDTKADDDTDTVTAPGASLDGASGWDNDEHDLDEITSTANGPPNDFPPEESNLVDHVPKRSFSRPTDASMAVMIDPMDAASQVDDNDINATTGRFGPVVDHTPRIPTTPIAGVAQSMLTQVSGVATDIRHEDDMDRTWFGASTVGGVSTVGASITAEGSSGEESSSADGSGWNEDVDAFDDLPSPTTAKRPIQNHEKHLVDHVPTITSPRPTANASMANASTAVVVDASVVSSQNPEDNNDQNMDEGTFGAVVDHTPSVARGSRLSTLSVANSMATHITGLAADIKADEDMDENTWNGGGSNQGDGWDQDDAELEDIADAADDDEMPHLVDHVPERPDSRPTDASTLVAADPSEMNSQVDDFGQDEENFGPVVDQTPLPLFNVAPSATTGSTIVASPSIVDDDLDDAVDAAIHGEERVVEQNQSGWEEVPNPQSGNEEDTEREQLVDYLPPDDDDEIPELVRDGSSEMATVGEKSVLPTDDPKEDEFGPVVDHTPIPDASVSSASVERRVGRREEESKKSGGLSSSSGHQNVDSVAPLFSVASSEDKDDGLDEDEFGPVVDQLPAVAAKSAFPASRGGSTVDALATVSEVDDDLNDGDGWEEDTIDVGGQASPSATSRPGEDRNLSVKWIDRLSEKDSAALLQKNANVSRQSNSTEFFDADTGDTSRLSLNETRYYDPEHADSSTWDDGLDALHGLDDEDDTPPSTPRQSIEFKRMDAAPRAPMVQNACGACSSANTADCPCVKKIIDLNRGAGTMVGKVKTPEGDLVEVNFEKLLETEVTRRRLLETESDALKSTIESLKASKNSLVQAGESQMTALNKLHGSNNELSDNLSRLKQECEKLRLENENVQSKNRKLASDISTLESEQKRSKGNEGTLKLEVESLKSSLSEASAAASEKLAIREKELTAELARSKTASTELYQQKMQLDTECENLRGKNESLYEDLESYRESISKLEETNSSLAANEIALSAEVGHLKTALENQTVTSSSTSQLEEQLRSIQSDQASKIAECEALKSQVAQLQQRLTTSEAENFKHTKEFARTAREHSQALASLEQRVNQKERELEDALSLKEAFVKEYMEKLSLESAASKLLREEKAVVKKELHALVDSHAAVSRDHQNQLNFSREELRSANGKIKALNDAKIALSSEVSRLADQLKAAESQTLEFLSVSRERDVLQEALVESKATISGLQNKISLGGELEKQVSSLRQQLQTVTNAKLSAEAGGSALQARFMELEQHYKTVEAAHNSSVGKCNFLESELSKTSEKLRTASAENEGLVLKLRQLQEETQTVRENAQRMQAEARLQSESSLENQGHVSELQSESNRLQQELARVNTITNDQSLKLQALEDELAEAASLMANKDQIIVILKEQQRSSRSQFQELQTENKAFAVRNQEFDEIISRLEAERDNLLKASEQHNAEVRELNEDVSRLIKERDDAVLERDGLEEDNEEMLVQFGLLKEQMDVSEDQLRQMQEELFTRESTVRELEIKLLEATKSIDDLGRSVGDQHASTAHFDSMREKWAEEKIELEQRLSEVDSEKNRFEQGMLSVESERHDLSLLVQDLQAKLDELISASQTKESQLISIVDSMEIQCNEARDKCHVLERELDLRSTDLENARAVGQDAEVLRGRCDELEQAVSEYQRLLQQKDAALQDLHFQLQHAGNAPQTSAELDTLRRAVQDLEGAAVKDRQHCRELEMQMDEKHQALDRAMRELSSANILTEQLQNDLNARKQKERMARGLEETLRKTEVDLETARKDAERLRRDSEELQNTISSLESELRDRQASHQSSQESSSQKSAEVESLRQEISVLRAQQAQSSKQAETREQLIEQQVQELQRQTQLKDSELQKLQRELHLLSNDLSQAHVDLAARQEYVDQLTSELEEMKEQASQPATTRVLDLTQDEAESEDKMRSHIISLANALGQSEIRRAEAIERLEKERKANADSLRRLTESVKRFYSTLSCGDS